MPSNNRSNTKRKIDFSTNDWLYVTNLSENVREIHIIELFSKFGEITDIRFMGDKTNKNKRFVFVRLQSNEQAVRAQAALNHHLLGRLKLNIRLATTQSTTTTSSTTASSSSSNLVREESNKISKNEKMKQIREKLNKIKSSSSSSLSNVEQNSS